MHNLTRGHPRVIKKKPHRGLTGGLSPCDSKAQLIYLFFISLQEKQINYVPLQLFCESSKTIKLWQRQTYDFYAFWD